MPTDRNTISILDAFKAYALSFEHGFATNDWSVVDAQLAADAHWIVHGADAPFGGTSQGREAVVEAIRQSTDGFDRRFDSREPRIVDGPTPIPGGVHFTWTVTYRRDGLPPFVLQGEEWDFFRDGKLEFHREKLWNAHAASEYLTEHGARMRPVS